MNYKRFYETYRIVFGFCRSHKAKVTFNSHHSCFTIALTRKRQERVIDIYLECLAAESEREMKLETKGEVSDEKLNESRKINGA